MATKRMSAVVAGLGAAVVIAAAQAAAAATPEETCMGSKNDAAGKLVACVTKALKAYYATADLEKYTAAEAKCQQKYAAMWQKAEDKALFAGGNCLTVDDDPEILSFLDACMTAVDDSLDGGGLPSDVLTCNEDLDYCDSELADCTASIGAGLLRTNQTTCYSTTSNVDGVTVPCAGSGMDGEHQVGVVRSYTDNGDGTITDNRTRLMWEKLSDDASIHDKDTNYANLASALAKVSDLNAMNFAGYNDWRMPNLLELASLVDYERVQPAIDPIFHTGCISGCTGIDCSCTLSNIYFVSTTYRLLTYAQWKVNFYDGDVYAMYKTDAGRVRAVRTLP